MAILPGANGQIQKQGATSQLYAAVQPLQGVNLRVAGE